ncbi:uncharacterized protein ASPGLDRAFT_770304 [Aspergillus glaucus CBS 516.65]|uniref:DDE-1 domain-containing protein n=1 Tax=Aspergillus glaucus CBS 516.65 TaxID=1160497 RepID=A0A1L9VAY5_ASPGL|nr:hypothetical protein ASPGLDRAFT_770304 [Aspergillus glaucus CBS 516.65]OJJ81088.1 hypothetical protein ASPGLDRAFT_770304 [Aspergillus glaucus CBS 516.65]
MKQAFKWVLQLLQRLSVDQTRGSRAKSLQPGNREWVTAIITINGAGTVLPPQIIFAGKKHQSQWYIDIPKDYRISTSENGWTNGDLGFEWLQEIFERYTASQAAGPYRLLILDGHSSHATAQFDQFCTARKIIPLYMPPHSSHLLQPPDVSCFGPLKKLYGQKIREAIQNGIYTIDKRLLISLYEHPPTSLLNIKYIQWICCDWSYSNQARESASKASIKLKTPTPPSSLNSNQSFYLGQSPANLYQLNKQKRQLQSQDLSSLIAGEVLEKFIKRTEVAMQNAVLLQQEVHQLRASEKRQKEKKKASRYTERGVRSCIHTFTSKAKAIATLQ